MMLVYNKPDRCAVCALPLQTYLTGVEDRVYGVAGRWNLDRCVDPACEVIYLAHDLTVEQLASFYASYSTHASPIIQSRGIKRVYREALASIRQRRLNYPGSVDWLPRLVGALLERVNFFRANALGRVFWLPYRLGGEVIEVGFGNAQTLYQLREAGWSVRGSEFDQACIDQARALGLDAVQGNFADGLFAADSADAVVASHTIEHLTDPSAFIREAYRVLRPGGMLVLVTPNAHSRDALKKGKDWRGLEVPRHLSIHTPGSLARMAKDANFIDVQVTGTPLSGFILQQSDELARGQTPSPAQSRKTWRYNVEASLMTMRHDQDSDEIVLRCVKP